MADLGFADLWLHPLAPERCDGIIELKLKPSLVKEKGGRRGREEEEGRGEVGGK